jgi:transposase
MPRAYSNDLRQRVIAACEASTQPRRTIAVQFQISEGTLYDWLRRWRKRGSFSSAPHGGGTVSHLDWGVLRELVEAQNDATLAEYADAYEQRTGRRYSIPRICTALKELRLSRKERRYAPRNTSRSRSRPSA